MIIASAEAIPLDAVLTAPFRFGRIQRSVSSNVLLRLVTDDGLVGYGEACPVPQLTGETQESVVALLEQRVGFLVGSDPLRWRPLIARIRESLYGAPFTAAAVDMAVLDLAGKALGVPVHALLGGAYRDAIEVHGSVSWDEDPEIVADIAEAQAARFRALKLYAGRGSVEDDLQRLRAARRRVGDAHPFLLDANGLWTPIEAIGAATLLRELGVVMAEQPVSPADARGQAEVTAAYATYGVDVVADERIRSPADVGEVAGGALARCANVGLSKLGGILAAFDAATIARALQLRVMVGSVVELGVATAAGVQLAASLPELSYPSYLMGPLKYARQITWPPLDPVNSTLPVPQTPGLGVAVDEEAVEALDRRNASKV